MFFCNWFVWLTGCVAGCLVDLIPCDISIFISKYRLVKIHFSFGEIILTKTLPNPISYLSMNPTVSLIQLSIIVIVIQLLSFVQNQFIIYVLVLFPTVRWIQMMPSTVCFGARDDSYGFSRTSKAGNIITFKLTYKFGYVTNPIGDAFKTVSFPTKWPR